MMAAISLWYTCLLFFSKSTGACVLFWAQSNTDVIPVVGKSERNYYRHFSPVLQNYSGHVYLINKIALHCAIEIYIMYVFMYEGGCAWLCCARCLWEAGTIRVLPRHISFGNIQPLPPHIWYCCLPNVLPMHWFDFVFSITIFLQSK